MTNELAVSNLFCRLQRRLILEGVSLRVGAGEVVVLIGPNGSGKSTLLRCIVGAYGAERGSMMVNERELPRLSASARATLLAYAPQETPVAFGFTVAELIGLSTPQGKEVDNAILQGLDLTNFQERSLLTLSGGERQRAGIARALVQDTPFLLLDEPTAHLDLRYQQRLLELLREEAGKGRGVLVVLHDLNLAATVADRIYLLSGGKIAATGTPTDVLTEAIIADVYQTAVRVADGGNGRPAIFLSR